MKSPKTKTSNRPEKTKLFSVITNLTDNASIISVSIN